MKTILQYIKNINFINLLSPAMVVIFFMFHIIQSEVEIHDPNTFIVLKEILENRLLHLIKNTNIISHLCENQRYSTYYVSIFDNTIFIKNFINNLPLEEMFEQAKDKKTFLDTIQELFYLYLEKHIRIYEEVIRELNSMIISPEFLDTFGRSKQQSQFISYFYNRIILHPLYLVEFIKTIDFLEILLQKHYDIFDMKQHVLALFFNHTKKSNQAFDKIIVISMLLPYVSKILYYVKLAWFLKDPEVIRPILLNLLKNQDRTNYIWLIIFLLSRKP